MIGHTLRICIALGLWTFAAAVAAAQDGAPPLPQSYQRDFTGLTQKPAEWGFYGPNAEKFVKFEAAGVRIILPVGDDRRQPETGLATLTTLKGDFEITARYEILAEPDVAALGNNYTRFTLSVLFASARGAATLSRRVQSQAGPQFFSWKNERDDATGKLAPTSAILSATARKGRLRIARMGDKLLYGAAEDDAKDFRMLAILPVGGEEIAEVRLVGATQGPNADLDVRVLDLQIRAAAMANPPSAPLSNPTGTLVAPTKQYAQEYFQSFKTGTAKPPGWEFEGPDIETSLAFHTAGAHFTLPTGWKGVRRPTGLKSIFGLKGDFEMTLKFDILAEPAPADAGSPVGTRLSLGIVKDTPHGDTSTLGRTITNSGRVAVAWANMWDEKAGKMAAHTGNLKRLKATTGQLRFVRSGADLYYGIADGPDGEFVFFKKYPFGAEDLREVRIITGTGTERASLDARVTDLRIRADAIPNMPASSPEPGGATPQQAQPTSGVRPVFLLAIILGAVVSLAIIVGLVVVMRKSSRKGAKAQR